MRWQKKGRRPEKGIAYFPGLPVVGSKPRLPKLVAVGWLAGFTAMLSLDLDARYGDLLKVGQEDVGPPLGPVAADDLPLVNIVAGSHPRRKYLSCGFLHKSNFTLNKKFVKRLEISEGKRVLSRLPC